MADEPDIKVGGDSLEDRMLLVTDAAVGEGMAMSLDDGATTPGVALRLTGRTMGDPPDEVCWDYLMTLENAQGVVGMLFEQLSRESRAHLIAVWQNHGMLS